MAKKKSKGVLEKIGDAVAAGAEAVIDAGSKAIHTVGDMMPTGKTPPKKAAKAKTAAKASKVKPKGAVAKPKAVSTKAGGTATKKAASAKAGGGATKKAAKPAKKAAARPKKASKKG